ncbi:MAG: hypothetical protein WDN08_06100 [Rhizomicrobium sp.]
MAKTDLTRLNECREALELAMVHASPAPTLALGTHDPFLAISVLQKALRRADSYQAHAAANTLLAIDRTRFWRRLAVIAFEDFGLSDIAVTAEIVAAASDHRWRQRAGGDPVVAHHLIDKLLRLPCDRSLDHLYSIAQGARTNPFLLQSLEDASPQLRLLLDRVRAVLAQCERPVPGKSFRSVQPRPADAALTAMAQEGILQPALFEICRQGRQTSQCALPILLPLFNAASKAASHQAGIATVALGSARTIAGIPSYAIGGHTTSGRAVLASVLRTDRTLQSLLRTAKGTKPLDAFASLLFLVEGGRSARELDDPFRADIRRMAQGCLTGLAPATLQDAVRHVEALLPQVDRTRERLFSARTIGARALTGRPPARKTAAIPKALGENRRAPASGRGAGTQSAQSAAFWQDAPTSPKVVNSRVKSRQHAASLCDWRARLGAMDGAYADNTIRSYRADFAIFEAWCQWPEPHLSSV